MTIILLHYFQCVLSLIMLSSDDIFALINYASFVESSFIGLSIAGMLYLRYSRPKMERPIKVSTVLSSYLHPACVYSRRIKPEHITSNCINHIMINTYNRYQIAASSTNIGVFSVLKYVTMFFHFVRYMYQS